MPSNIARFDAYRSIAAASITGSYQTLGTPLGHSVRIFRLLNNTDADIKISVDTTNDNFYLPAASFLLFDIAANDDADDSFRVSHNTQFYIKYASGAPTTGNFVLENIYGQGE